MSDYFRGRYLYADRGNRPCLRAPYPTPKHGSDFPTSRCGMIYREVSREQTTLFCVCCIAGGSRCSSRTGEVTSAGHAASEPDYRKRKGSVLVCEQRRHRCGAENARRKLLLQADTRGSKFWPDRWPCGRRFEHVLLAKSRRIQPSKGNRKNKDLEGRACCRT